MLDYETARKLESMNLKEFIEAYNEQELLIKPGEMGFQERFKLLVDSAFSKKTVSTFKRLIKSAHLRDPQAGFENIIFTANRGFDKDLINDLKGMTFLSSNQSLALCGPSGSGKTWLSCAIGKQACRLSKKVLYYRTPNLLDEIREKETLPGGLKKMINKLARVDLLILDEWLLYNIESEESKIILEILERRYDQHPTIFCSLYNMDEWYERFEEGTQTDSIMDRIIHNCSEIQMGKENMRALKH